jgi:hypothetical protein
MEGMMKQKLSQLIRDGAKLRPQTTELYFRHLPNGDCEGSCVIGAAIEALTGKTRHYDIRQLPSLDKSASCPDVACRRTSDIHDICAHLNDDHKWSRERIADNIASLGY